MAPEQPATPNAASRDGKGLGPGNAVQDGRTKPAEPRTNATAQGMPRLRKTRRRKGAAPWRRCRWYGSAANRPPHPMPTSSQTRHSRGLRVVPAGDRIAGASVTRPGNGASAAAGRWQARHRCSSSRRPVLAKKLEPARRPVAERVHRGDLPTAGAVYLARASDGIKACWKATGAAAVVILPDGGACGAGAQLRQRDPSSARLVLVPDDGQRSRSGPSPANWPRSSADHAYRLAGERADVNGLAQRDGFDALEALLLAPKVPGLQRFQLLVQPTANTTAALAWCDAAGVLPRAGLPAMYSRRQFRAVSSKCWTLPPPLLIGADGGSGYPGGSTGSQWCTAPGWDGLSGAGGRAWEETKGAHARWPAAGATEQSFKLTDRRTRMTRPGTAVDSAGWCRGHPRPAGFRHHQTDETHQPTWAASSKPRRRLQRLTDGLVLVVHHTGKDTATRGLRGHSSLFAALDAAVEVTRGATTREWRWHFEAKDGQDGAWHPFRLEVVDLGEDGEGRDRHELRGAPDGVLGP